MKRTIFQRKGFRIIIDEEETTDVDVDLEPDDEDTSVVIEEEEEEEDLPPHAERIRKLINERWFVRPKTLSEVCDESGLSKYDAKNALSYFIKLGLMSTSRSPRANKTMYYAV